MKTMKILAIIALTTLTIFTSCQSEENEQVGTNPNANSSTSQTAENYERTAMNDGSEDDFLDNNSCTELLFPLTATINGQEITLISSLDYEKVLEIMGEFNDDDDTVIFNFPIRVKLSNYTELTVASEADFNELKTQCEEASNAMEEAISCVNISFPITMLTYDVNIEQTGTVVVQSEEQLYNFMTDLNSDEYFSVKYPITVTLSDGTTVQVNSDAEFQDSIEECTSYEEEEETAEETADEVEAIISKSKFKVESFIEAGINKANEYADYTIEFTNDLKLVARNTVNTTLENIEGTYSVSSDIKVFLNISFASNTALSALSNDWIVTTYTSTMVTLQSKTDASVTLTFKKI
ncbi:hypothetical protein [Tenacibaculum caenipelagi]|uniref:Lipoprotein n=1 Tax=Tenacibaculum caenipelagi TaxID=1325435 RepID=A0A4R6TCF8_9FLAO|nr:hypothetical protein [Tenacibaculum caenipelagi]TDQ22032.1 hypothetical protein DFQ07_3131 [Tenacibaculum caenipelagi]